MSIPFSCDKPVVLTVWRIIEWCLYILKTFEYFGSWRILPFSSAFDTIISRFFAIALDDTVAGLIVTGCYSNETTIHYLILYLRICILCFSPSNKLYRIFPTVFVDCAFSAWKAIFGTGCLTSAFILQRFKNIENYNFSNIPHRI